MQIGSGARNPWKEALTCGGSSGGCAAAVAAGYVHAALASDLASSICLPAALTGIVGFKVLLVFALLLLNRLVSQQGGANTAQMPGLTSGFTSYGFMTRSVRDLVFILDKLYPRLGLWDPAFFNNYEPRDTGKLTFSRELSAAGCCAPAAAALK